ncbi:MAG: hypothetical protein KatS3mg023_3388 [Armatimonadota bacterium]|nr:MAG: hypothetical protein KatS3mg023_3388 [Armatimonadota bacterium]
MKPDDVAIRPVVYGNAIRPVHRESPSRDSTGGQRPPTREQTEAEEPETIEDGEQTVPEETHLIDLRV